MEQIVPFTPELGGTFASRVDSLYGYLILITLIFSIGIALTLIYFAAKYRRRSETMVPKPIAGSIKLEVLWTVVPFLLTMTMFAWGTSIYFAQYRMPNTGMEIYIVAKQWMWKAQHTGG